MKIKIQMIFCVFFFKIYCHEGITEILKEKHNQFIENCKSMLREYEACIKKQEILNEYFFKDLIIEYVVKYIESVNPTLEKIKALYKNHIKNENPQTEIFKIDDIEINREDFEFLTSTIVLLSLEKIIHDETIVKHIFLTSFFKILHKIVNDLKSTLEEKQRDLMNVLSAEFYLYNIEEISKKQFIDAEAFSKNFINNLLPDEQKSEITKELIDIFKMMVKNYNNYIYTAITTIPKSKVALIIETEFKPLFLSEILNCIGIFEALCIKLKLHLPIAKIFSTSLKVITEDKFFIKHETNDITHIFSEGSEQISKIFYEFIGLINK